MADEQLKLPPGATLVQDQPMRLPSGATLVDDPSLEFIETTKEGIPVYRRPAGDIPGQLADIPKGAWENLVQSGKGMIDVGGAVVNTMVHPLDTLSGRRRGVGSMVSDIGEAQDALRLKVADAWKRGDYPTAAANALYYMIPMLGPQLSEESEMASKGEWGRATGHVLGTAAQLAAPEMLKGTQVPLSPRFQVKPQLNQIEQANQLFLESEGVETPLSMQTGSPTARNLQGSVEQDIGGSQYAKEARLQTRQQIQQVAQQKAYDVAPGPSVTPEQAGEAVLGKFKGDIRQLDFDANTSYRNAWRVENDPANVKQVPKEVRTPNGWDYVTDPNTGQVVMEDIKLPHDMRPMKMALRPIAERYARTLSDTQARASLGLKTMRDIINGPDYKPLSQAELDLGLLKQAARQERGMAELRNPSQGLAAYSLSQLQQDIDSTMGAARGGQQGLADLQAGRSATAKKWSIYEQAKKFGKPNIEEIEPVSVYNKLTGDRDIRTQFLNRVRAMAPAQMPLVGRAFVEELLNRVFREGDIKHSTEALNQWDNLGPKTKLALFRNPGLISDLDNTFLAFKRLADQPNPSGSGYIIALNKFRSDIARGLGLAAGAATGGLQHGMAGAGEGAGLGLVAGQGLHMISNAALARLLFNPKWTSLLRRGIQLQVSGDKVGAAAAVAQLLKESGNDAQPVDRKRPPLSTFERQ